MPRKLPRDVYTPGDPERAPWPDQEQGIAPRACWDCGRAYSPATQPGNYCADCTEARLARRDP